MLVVNASKLKTEYSRNLQGERRPNVGKKKPHFFWSGTTVLVAVVPAPAFSALSRYASVTQRQLRSRTDQGRWWWTKMGMKGINKGKRLHCMRGTSPGSLAGRTGASKERVRLQQLFSQNEVGDTRVTVTHWC